MTFSAEIGACEIRSPYICNTKGKLKMRAGLLSCFALVLLFVWSSAALAQDGAYIGLQWMPQTEQQFLVRLDPYTGTVSPIGYIPGVKTISGGFAFNSEKGQYVFTGHDSAHVPHHVVVDAQTGELLSRIPRQHQINCLAYDPDTDLYFGVWWDGPDSTEYFVSFDPFTANMTLIDSIPGVRWVNGATPVVSNGHYLLVAYDRFQNGGIYVIEVETGATVNVTPIDPRMSAPQYDAFNDIHSLMYFDSASVCRLVHLDPMTGASNVIASYPELRGIQSGAGPAEPGRMVLTASDHDHIHYRMVINTLTGEVLSKIPFNPTAPWVNGVVYHAKHRVDSPAEDNRLFVYPNPTTGPVTIELPSWAGEEGHTLRMFDTSGRIVKKWDTIETGVIRLDVTGISSGIYMLQLLDANRPVGFGRLSVR